MSYVKEVAILGLVILEASALLTGNDGVFFLPVCGLIGYIAGLKTEKVIELFKK